MSYLNNKQRISTTVLFFFVLVSVSAQKPVKLWTGTDITCKQKNTELTAFAAEQPDTSGISVIICPGGSYFWLDMNNEGYSVAKYLNGKGITAFVLQYRTAKHGNHHPAMIQDLQQAIRYVKENADTFGINPDRVGVMGFSAGGHLAGTAAEYFDNDNKPYFAAMIYPVVSMEDSICHKKSRKNLLCNHFTEKKARTMSLEKNVRTDMPPIFLLHCIGDKTVDYRNSVVMDNALTEKNIPHKFLLFDEYGHGFGIQPNGKATGWIDEFVEWVFSKSVIQYSVIQ
jgi:acetyl esterase/lipase